MCVCVRARQCEVVVVGGWGGGSALHLCVCVPERDCVRERAHVHGSCSEIAVMQRRVLSGGGRCWRGGTGGGGGVLEAEGAEKATSSWVVTLRVHSGP